MFDLGMMNACEVRGMDGTSQLQIMDGQQRIVTILLIYAAIRRILLDSGGADEKKFAKGSVACSCNRNDTSMIWARVSLPYQVDVAMKGQGALFATHRV